MDSIRSLYLDLFRIISALYVFIYHFGTEEINGLKLFSIDSFKENWNLKDLSAHYFVIVFFVLSGFLITMSISKPTIKIRSFMVARLGRIYSVVFPGLIFTYAVYLGLTFMNVYNVEEVPNNKYLIFRAFMNLTFVSQSLDFFSVPPMNAAFWSISYEVVYYFIIAIIFFVKGYKKYLLLILVFIFSFKIMLLLPCWLIGSLLFYIISKNKLAGTFVSSLLFIISSLLILLIVQGYVILPLEEIPSSTNNFFGIRLFHSNNFKADYLFAILFATNMYGFFGISNIILKIKRISFFEKFEKTVSIIANCSFTLYLFHMPLLFLFSSLAPYDKSNAFHQFFLIIIVLISVYFIAQKTEWKTELWRKYIENMFNFLDRKTKYVLTVLR